MSTDQPLNVLTYTAATTLCLCERKYEYRYERCLRLKRDDDSDALVIGSAFHVGAAAYLSVGLDAGLEAIGAWREAHVVLGPDENRRLDERAAKARAMLRASALKWPREDIAAGSEQVVSCPIRNPQTGASSRSFTLMGRVDGIVGRTLLDWKGVSYPNDFIRAKRIGYQIECYALALMEAGTEIDSAEFRLVTRPSIRLCGKDKDAAAYEERCFEWLASDATTMVHHDHFVTDSRLDNAREWMWTVSQRVLNNRKSGRWLTNELACKAWNRDCDYLPLCLIGAHGGDTGELIAHEYEHCEAHPELVQTDSVE